MEKDDSDNDVELTGEYILHAVQRKSQSSNSYINESFKSMRW